MNDQLLLGIDGGGSKTALWLARAVRGDQPAVLGKASAPASNPCAVGGAAAIESLAVGITAVFEAAGLARQTVAATVLAIAGTEDPLQRQPLEAWLNQQQIALRYRFVNDAEPLLAAGTSSGHGLALIAGTGAFGFARHPDGRTARCSGWGYLFGDEGGGYWLARAGLRAAARAADGRDQPTELLPAFLRELRVAQPLHMIGVVYQQLATREQVAALSRVVLECADQGDSTAQQIVTRGARELAQVIVSLRRQLSLPPDAELACGGSLIARPTRLFVELSRGLRDDAGFAGAIRQVPEPVAGAIVLASRLQATPV